MDYDKINCQTLSVEEKRIILSDLGKFLNWIDELYKKNDVSCDAVKSLIKDNRKVITAFAKLMQNDGKIWKDPSVGDTLKKNEEYPEKKVSTNRKEISSLDDIKEYINNMIERRLSEIMREQIHILSDQYMNLQKKYELIQSRLIELQTTKYNCETTTVNTAYSNQVQSKKEDTEDTIENYQKEKCQNENREPNISNDVKWKLNKITSIYNQKIKAGTLAIRKQLKTELKKPIIRLILPQEQGRDFANKSLSDLKREKKGENVNLISTDGSSDYIAQELGDNIYAVFPERFSNYTQHFAWKRAYPIFFDIMPRDDMEAFSYKIEQPALFKKSGNQYQMIENGKGRIVLEE